MAASRLSWQVILMHCPQDCHEHPLETFSGVASGSFTAPDHQYPAHLKLRLTATDAHGLSHTTDRDLDPATVDLTFATTPSGLTLTVGGATGAAPFTRRVIVGSANSLSADSPQTIGGVSYRWTGMVRWRSPEAMTSPLQRQLAHTPRRTPRRRTLPSRRRPPSERAGHVHGHHAEPGGIGASNVAVVDTLPSKLVVLRYSGSSGGCTFAAATRQVSCPIGTLSAGATATTTIVATNGNAKGQVQNAVRVTSITPDSNPANDASTIGVKLR